MFDYRGYTIGWFGRRWVIAHHGQIVQEMALLDGAEAAQRWVDRNWRA